MSYNSVGRRQFLQYMATGAGAVWFRSGWNAVSEAGDHAAAIPDHAAFEVLTPAEVLVLEAMASRIIPTDDTPGAREARVVRFMDRSLATFAADALPLMRQGIAQLEADVKGRMAPVRSFAQLDPAAQDILLQQMDTAGSVFFELVRVGTIQGMFANPEYGGNFEKTGWKLLGFVDQFTWSAPFGDYDRG